MKYLGPILVGGVITVGSIVAIQSSWVSPPTAERPSDPLESALFGGNLNVPSRSVPLRRADEAAGEVRRIALPTPPPGPADAPVPDAPVPGEETAVAEAPLPVPPLRPAVAEPVADADAAPEGPSVEPAPPPDEPVLAALPAPEVAEGDAASRVADVFETLPDEPPEGADALAAAAALAARAATGPEVADPIGGLVEVALAAADGEATPGPQPDREVPDAAVAVVAPGPAVAEEPAAGEPAPPPPVEVAAVPSVDPQPEVPPLEAAAASPDAATVDPEAALPPRQEPAETSPAEVAALPPPAAEPPAPADTPAAPLEDSPSAMLFLRVSVLDAVTMRGIRDAQAVMVRLSGLRPSPFGERCGEGAGAWPCGSLARAELSRFIADRPVVCVEEVDVSSRLRIREVVASCQVGDSDIGLWLAGSGWAIPTSGAPAELRAAADEAERRGLGRHAASSPLAAAD